jgi:hypothetical protein
MYNGAAWWYRRERHLGINSVVYATAAAWEVVQVRRHWSRLAAMRRLRISSTSDCKPQPNNHRAA